MMKTRSAMRSKSPSGSGKKISVQVKTVNAKRGRPTKSTPSNISYTFETASAAQKLVFVLGGFPQNQSTSRNGSTDTSHQRRRDSPGGSSKSRIYDLVYSDDSDNSCSSTDSAKLERLRKKADELNHTLTLLREKKERKKQQQAQLEADRGSSAESDVERRLSSDDEPIHSTPREQPAPKCGRGRPSKKAIPKVTARDRRGVCEEPNQRRIRVSNNETYIYEPRDENHDSPDGQPDRRIPNESSSARKMGRPRQATAEEVPTINQQDNGRQSAEPNSAYCLPNTRGPLIDPAPSRQPLAHNITPDKRHPLVMLVAVPMEFQQPSGSAEVLDIPENLMNAALMDCDANFENDRGGNVHSEDIFLEQPVGTEELFRSQIGGSPLTVDRGEEGPVNNSVEFGRLSYCSNDIPIPSTDWEELVRVAGSQLRAVQGMQSPSQVNQVENIPGPCTEVDENLGRIVQEWSGDLGKQREQEVTPSKAVLSEKISSSKKLGWKAKLCRRSSDGKEGETETSDLEAVYTPGKSKITASSVGKDNVPQNDDSSSLDSIEMRLSQVFASPAEKRSKPNKDSLNKSVQNTEVVSVNCSVPDERRVQVELPLGAACENEKQFTQDSDRESIIPSTVPTSKGLRQTNILSFMPRRKTNQKVTCSTVENVSETVCVSSGVPEKHQECPLVAVEENRCRTEESGSLRVSPPSLPEKSKKSTHETTTTSTKGNHPSSADPRENLTDLGKAGSHSNPIRNDTLPLPPVPKSPVLLQKLAAGSENEGKIVSKKSLAEKLPERQTGSNDASDSGDEGALLKISGPKTRTNGVRNSPAASGIGGQESEDSEDMMLSVRTIQIMRQQIAEEEAAHSSDSDSSTRKQKENLKTADKKRSLNLKTRSVRDSKDSSSDEEISPVKKLRRRRKRTSKDSASGDNLSDEQIRRKSPQNCTDNRSPSVEKITENTEKKCGGHTETAKEGSRQSHCEERAKEALSEKSNENLGNQTAVGNEGSEEPSERLHENDVASSETERVTIPNSKVVSNNTTSPVIENSKTIQSSVESEPPFESSEKPQAEKEDVSDSDHLSSSSDDGTMSYMPPKVIHQIDIASNDSSHSDDSGNESASKLTDQDARKHCGSDVSQSVVSPKDAHEEGSLISKPSSATKSTQSEKICESDQSKETVTENRQESRDSAEDSSEEETELARAKRLIAMKKSVTPDEKNVTAQDTFASSEDDEVVCVETIVQNVGVLTAGGQESSESDLFSDSSEEETEVERVRRLVELKKSGKETSDSAKVNSDMSSNREVEIISAKETNLEAGEKQVSSEESSEEETELEKVKKLIEKMKAKSAGDAEVASSDSSDVSSGEELELTASRESVEKLSEEHPSVQIARAKKLIGAISDNLRSGKVLRLEENKRLASESSEESSDGESGSTDVRHVSELWAGAENSGESVSPAKRNEKTSNISQGNHIRTYSYVSPDDSSSDDDPEPVFLNCSNKIDSEKSSNQLVNASAEEVKSEDEVEESLNQIVEMGNGAENENRDELQLSDQGSEYETKDIDEIQIDEEHYLPKVEEDETGADESALWVSLSQDFQSLTEKWPRINSNDSGLNSSQKRKKKKKKKDREGDDSYSSRNEKKRKKAKTSKKDSKELDSQVDEDENVAESEEVMNEDQDEPVSSEKKNRKGRRVAETEMDPVVDTATKKTKSKAKTSKKASKKLESQVDEDETEEVTDEVINEDQDEQVNGEGKKKKRKGRHEAEADVDPEVDAATKKTKSKGKTSKKASKKLDSQVDEDETVAETAVVSEDQDEPVDDQGKKKKRKGRHEADTEVDAEIDVATKNTESKVSESSAPTAELKKGKKKKEKIPVEESDPESVTTKSKRGGDKNDEEVSEEVEEEAVTTKSQKGKNKRSQEANGEAASSATGRKKKKLAVPEETPEVPEPAISHLPSHFLKDLSAVKPHSSIRKGETMKAEKKKKPVKPKVIIESEDFIPLESGGSTQFGAVSLDSQGVAGREKTVADFKQRMLFGDRKRRTPVKTAEVIRMKQKASRL